MRSRREGRRSRGVRRGLALGLLLTMVAGGLACEGEQKRGRAEFELFETAPPFVLPLLAGGEIDLAALRGKTVIVDFWATWCAPCEVQMPILDALWKDADRSRLAIVGVSVDTDSRASVAAWVEERGLSYPIAFGDQRLTVDFGLIGLPSLVLIDPEGRIRLRHTGVLGREEIEERLEAIRGGAP